MADQSKGQIVLPERLVSSVDLSRTIRELEALDESLRQAELRKPGEPTKLSRSSVTLEEMAKLNNIALTDGVQRQQMLAVLKAFYQNAPRIHMSFAAEPSANFVRKILVWMRSNLSPIIVLEIGLQPTLAAGCMIRTTNKMFDMSLRHRFADNRYILVEKITEIGAAKESAEESLAIAAANAKLAAEAEEAKSQAAAANLAKVQSELANPAPAPAPEPAPAPKPEPAPAAPIASKVPDFVVEASAQKPAPAPAPVPQINLPDDDLAGIMAAETAAAGPPLPGENPDEDPELTAAKAALSAVEADSKNGHAS
jgi:hypothetical protein